MKVNIQTLGCKVNQSESTIIEGTVKKHGFDVVSLSEIPDYSIVNTCSVTSKSDYQSRQLIRRAVKSGSKVMVTGCYSQLNRKDVININKDIVIIENINKMSIINMLLNDSECKSLIFNYSNRARPYLKIQDGCDFRCTYCIVPLARGKSRSLEEINVLKRAISLEKAGFQEIILTGIHLGSYGYDLKMRTNLTNLIKKLLVYTKIKRIRLSSLEINEMSEELIELFQEKRICNHVHLPIQSGDKMILNRMHRKYNVKKYLKVIEKLIKKIPEIAIGTDIIVGFPGEGEKEFLNTKDLVEILPFAYIHIFPFSKRPKTIASRILKQNSSSVKKDRFKQLNIISLKKKRAYMKSQIGKTLDVVIEKRVDEKISIGTSSNYMKVGLNLLKPSNGTIVNARIERIEGELLRANYIDNI